MACYCSPGGGVSEKPSCDEMVAASVAARSAVRMRRSQNKDVDGIDDEQPAAIHLNRNPFPMDRG